MPRNVRVARMTEMMNALNVLILKHLVVISLFPTASEEQKRSYFVKVGIRKEGSTFHLRRGASCDLFDGPPSLSADLRPTRYWNVHRQRLFCHGIFSGSSWSERDKYIAYFSLLNQPDNHLFICLHGGLTILTK